MQQLENLWQDTLAFLPDLAAAVLIGIVAYIIAKIASMAVRKGVQRVGAKKGEKRTPQAVKDRKMLGNSLGKAIFWIIILVALPMILAKLNLSEAARPLENMINTVLSYLPRIIGAAFIIGIGALIATIAKRAIQSLLEAAPIDVAAAKGGMGDVVKGPAIAKAVGMVVFALILIPSVIAGLDTLAIDAVTTPATEMLQRVMAAIPNIFAASVVLLLAFLIGKAAKSIIASVLAATGFDNIWSSFGFSATSAAMDNVKDSKQAVSASSFSATNMVANGVMVLIIVFGLIEATKLLQFEQISLILNSVLEIAGRILLGAVFILVGIFVARFVSNLIRQSGGAQSELMATIAQYGIIILVSAMGLREMGLGDDIVFLAFGLSMAAAALAAGLAFGIGGRETAHKVLEDWRAKK